MSMQAVTGPTIKAGEFLSNAIDCRGCIRVARVIVPKDWDAAPITFQLSPDGVDFHDLYHTVPDSYTTFELTVPNPEPGSSITLPIEVGFLVNFVKVRSGTPSVPIRQNADRSFQFVLEMETVPPAGPTGATGPIGPPGTTGATGATVGWQRVQNVLNCWGTVVATTSGTQIIFPQAYKDDLPVITTGGQAGGILQVTAVSKSGFTITCNSGTPTVYWRAVGS